VTPGEREETLRAIATEVESCTQCRLASGRTRAVPGEGHPDTEVVFVGEGPGYNEDQQGRPFVGAAGAILDDLLGAIGWKRSDVFITNVVKCRPPGNRDPEPEEIAACAPFLRRQLEVLDPALVVTLGRFSMQTFQPGARIGQVHGTMRPVDSATGARNAMAYPMYHPAAALRQYSLRDTLRADAAGIPDALLRSRERRAASTGSDAAATSGTPATSDAPAAVGAAPMALPPPGQSDATEAAAPTSDTPDELLADVTDELVTLPPQADAPPDPNQMSLF
jgi:DNA polymerase